MATGGVRHRDRFRSKSTSSESHLVHHEPESSGWAEIFRLDDNFDTAAAHSEVLGGHVADVLGVIEVHNARHAEKNSGYGVLSKIFIKASFHLLLGCRAKRCYYSTYLRYYKVLY